MKKLRFLISLSMEESPYQRLLAAVAWKPPAASTLT
jgi:hypothetical protein